MTSGSIKLEMSPIRKRAVERVGKSLQPHLRGSKNLAATTRRHGQTENDRTPVASRQTERNPKVILIDPLYTPRIQSAAGATGTGRRRTAQANACALSRHRSGADAAAKSKSPRPSPRE